MRIGVWSLCCQLGSSTLLGRMEPGSTIPRNMSGQTELGFTLFSKQSWSQGNGYHGSRIHCVHPAGRRDSLAHGKTTQDTSTCAHARMGTDHKMCVYQKVWGIRQALYADVSNMMLPGTHTYVYMYSIALCLHKCKFCYITISSQLVIIYSKRATSMYTCMSIQTCRMSVCRRRVAKRSLDSSALRDTRV